MDVDRDLDVALDVEEVCAGAEAAVDRAHVLVGVRAPERGHLDRRVGVGAEQLLDRVRLVRLRRRDVARACAVADVEVQVVGPGVRCVPVLSAVLLAGHVDGLRQLEVADREVRGRRDREEPEVDRHGDGQLDLGAARTVCVEGEVEADAERDPEDVRVDARAARELEGVDRVPRVVAVDRRADAEVEVAADPEGGRPDRHAARELDVELPVGGQVDGAGERRDPEEVEARARQEAPGAAGHDDAQLRAELQHLEDLDLAVQVEQEGVRVDAEA